MLIMLHLCQRTALDDVKDAYYLIGHFIVCCSSPSTHKMSPWVKRVFLHFMPRLLMMRRPPYSSRDNFDDNNFGDNVYTNDLDFR
jgi:Neurotransmitter-gated ion-channel transmembrane region.